MQTSRELYREQVRTKEVSAVSKKWPELSFQNIKACIALFTSSHPFAESVM